MSRSFGLDALSALEELKDVMARFNNDDLNVSLARECSKDAWHLCDHAFKALASTSPFTTVRDLQEHVRKTCPDLGYLQDVCTESKHAEITKYAPQVAKARCHEGDFSRHDFDPKDFDVSRLEIKLVDGRVIVFSDVVNRAADYWSQFFKNNGIK